MLPWCKVSVECDGMNGLEEDVNHDHDDCDAGDGVDGLGEERGNPGEDRQGYCSEAQGCLRWKGDCPG